MEASAGDEDGKVCTLYEKKADTDVAMDVSNYTCTVERRGKCPLKCSLCLTTINGYKF